MILAEYLTTFYILYLWILDRKILMFHHQTYNGCLRTIKDVG